MKYPRLVAFRQQKMIPQCSGSWKSEVKVSAKNAEVRASSWVANCHLLIASSPSRKRGIEFSQCLL
jgi:hypothetical protein